MYHVALAYLFIHERRGVLCVYLYYFIRMASWTALNCENPSNILVWFCTKLYLGNRLALGCKYKFEGKYWWWVTSGSEHCGAESSTYGRHLPSSLLSLWAYPRQVIAEGQEPFRSSMLCGAWSCKGQEGNPEQKHAPFSAELIMLSFYSNWKMFIWLNIQLWFYKLVIFFTFLCMYF